MQIDVILRHLTAIRRLPASLTGEGMPGHAEMDVRVAWRKWKQAEASIVGHKSPASTSRRIRHSAGA
jgi:hypothetical protein